MKNVWLLVSILSLALLSCNNKSSETKTTVANIDDSLLKQRFFPVTTYIKGQLYNIKEKGLAPILYTTIGNKKDSAFIKFEDLEKTVEEFLTPTIDSTSLISFFKEVSFVDKSINAATFTYDAVKKLPDTIFLKSWNVYIEPQTGTVKTIFLIKKKENKTIQLTWNNNANCKMVYLTTDEKGDFSIEKEVKLSWDY